MKCWLLCLVAFCSFHGWKPPGVDLLLASLPAPELEQVMTCYEMHLDGIRLQHFAEAQELVGDAGDWSRWQWCDWLTEARDNDQHPFHEQTFWITRNGCWDLVALGQTYLLLSLAEAEQRVAEAALELGDGEWASWFRQVTLDDSHPFNEEWLPVLQMRQRMAAELKFWEGVFEGGEEFEEALDEYGLRHHIDDFVFIDRWVNPTNLDWQVRYDDARSLFEEVTESIRQRVANDPPPSVPDPASAGWELMRGHQLRQLASEVLAHVGGHALRWQWAQWIEFLSTVIQDLDHPLHDSVQAALEFQTPLLDEEFSWYTPEEELYSALEDALQIHPPSPYLSLYEDWIEQGYLALSPRARHALGALIYSVGE
jgi:hypothetical protein